MKKWITNGLVAAILSLSVFSYGEITGLRSGVQFSEDGGITGLHSGVQFADSGVSIVGLKAAFSWLGQSTIVPEIGTTPTFTRATTATVEDFEGLIKPTLSGEVRFKGGRRLEQLVDKPEGIDLGNWFKSNCTITTGIIDPDGGTTAFRMTATSAAAILQNNATHSDDGETVIGSWWVKRVTGTGTVQMTDGSDGGNITTITSVLTTDWQRIAATARVMTATGVHGVRISTDGDVVDIWHPQYEYISGQSVTAPSEYRSHGVLSAPYHGANVDGVQYFTTLNGNTVASNVVTEANGVAISGSDSHADVDGPFGYLSEGARTNISLHSQAFGDAVWTASNVTVTDNDTAGPWGTTTAELLTSSAGNGTVIQDLGIIGGAIKAGGFWIKRKTGTGDIDLTLDGGSTWTTKTVTAGWTRVQISQTLANPDVGIRIVTSADAVWVEGGQVEAASFLSSDIVTAGSAVTRNADVMTVAFPGIDAAGTAYAEVSSNWASVGGSARYALGRASTGQLLYSVNSDADVIWTRDDTNTSVSPAGTSYENAVQAVASTWGNALTAYFNGDPDASPASYDGAMGSGDLEIGSFNGGIQQWDGTIRHIKLFKPELTAAQVPVQ